MYTRRKVIGCGISCAAHVGLMAAGSPVWARKLWASQNRFPIDVSEPWGRLERVAEGIWALVSTPLQDRTTLCNGGFVAGRAGVVVIEGFASDTGASWMIEQATRLVGRRPTHVVLSHYHGDHTGGLRGTFEGGDLEVIVPDVTREHMLNGHQEGLAEILGNATLLVGRRPTEIALGDRSLILVPRRGHTDSDLSVEIPDSSVVFCGDLVWNAMFPNYVDAAPSRLSQEVRVMRARGATTYVPGHGPLADNADLDAYIGLLDHLEGAARAAIDQGMSAEEAGAVYSLPQGLEDWTLFSPDYFSRAISSWMVELRA